MANLVLRVTDDKIHLVHRDHYLGHPRYTSLAEIEFEFALEIGRHGVVFWQGNVIGRPIRPGILFSDQRTEDGRVIAEIHRCFFNKEAPALTFEISEREALSIIKENEINVVVWEGGEPEIQAVAQERLAA